MDTAATGPAASGARCIALLGGSFDPVHNGHVAMAHYVAVLLAPDEVRILPAGDPYQKPPLTASAEHRIAMLELALRDLRLPLTIDRREIDRKGPTYTIDTLRELRGELGTRASLTLTIGADQLQRLDTWRNWRALFDHAHLCVVSRPGYTTESAKLPDEVRREFARRTASPAQLRGTPHGLTHIATALAVDTSSTQLRADLRAGKHPGSTLPPAVLDYIQQHHLYRN